MTTPAQTSSAMNALTSGALSTTVVPAASPTSLAVNVASVKTHVPIVLDLQASNYSKWRMLMGVLLGKYELTGHISIDTPAGERTAEWSRLDYVVRSWLYGSISDDILGIIMAQDQTAYEAYALIRNLFLDNQLTRAIYLEAEFRAIVQGDLTITAYCHRLKSLSDALRDVGQPVSDQTLVLTCLRGLNPRFADIITLVTMQVPAPTLLQTRSLLLLRENQLAHPAPGTPSPSSSQIALYGNTAGQQAYTTQLAPLHGNAFGSNPPPPATPYVQPGPGAHGNGAPAWDCSALVAALNSTFGDPMAGSSTTGTWLAFAQLACTYGLSFRGYGTKPNPTATTTTSA
ncbi:uncharacterized protein [Aegilops tauschii subsp. strangulata]|uniref:uncharacterized protein n=1 Tax=Aegilops tauschii subsp. strangulata TaxID=200361 RepID=UPI003CC8607B